MNNDATTKPTGRGGAGRGQGRKPSSPSGLTRERFEFKIDPVVLRWLRERKEPAGALIEKAVIAHYGLTVEDGEKISSAR
jgi:hypothetical protein